MNLLKRQKKRFYHLNLNLYFGGIYTDMFNRSKKNSLIKKAYKLFYKGNIIKP